MSNGLNIIIYDGKGRIEVDPEIAHTERIQKKKTGEGDLPTQNGQKRENKKTGITTQILYDCAREAKLAGVKTGDIYVFNHLKLNGLDLSAVAPIFGSAINAWVEPESEPVLVMGDVYNIRLKVSSIKPKTGANASPGYKARSLSAEQLELLKGLKNKVPPNGKDAKLSRNVKLADLITEAVGKWTADAPTAIVRVPVDHLNTSKDKKKFLADVAHRASISAKCKVEARKLRGSNDKSWKVELRRTVVEEPKEISESSPVAATEELKPAARQVAVTYTNGSEHQFSPLSNVERLKVFQQFEAGDVSRIVFPLGCFIGPNVESTHRAFTESLRKTLKVNFRLWVDAKQMVLVISPAPWPVRVNKVRETNTQKMIHEVIDILQGLDKVMISNGYDTEPMTYDVDDLNAFGMLIEALKAAKNDDVIMNEYHVVAVHECKPAPKGRFVINGKLSVKLFYGQDAKARAVAWLKSFDDKPASEPAPVLINATAA